MSISDLINVDMESPRRVILTFRTAAAAEQFIEESALSDVAQGAEPYYRWVGGLCFMYWENKDGELQCKQIDAAPAQVALTDAQIDAVIEESDGYWCDDEFRINGKDLMNLCRALTAAQSASGDAK